MAKVRPEEIRSNRDYELARDAIRARILAIKAPRRIHCGDELTFLFENHDTVLYQVQEMARAEKIEDPRAIRHELDTYNELVSGPGELSATLLVEIADPEVRDRRLRELVGLEGHVAIEIEGVGRIRAEFDLRQMSPEKVSSVHYVRFPIGKAGADAIARGAATTLETDHPKLSARAKLSEEQRLALAEDLAAG